MLSTLENLIKLARESQGDHIVRSTLQTSGSAKKLIAEKSIFVYDSDETRVSEALNPVLVR